MWLLALLAGLGAPPAVWVDEAGTIHKAHKSYRTWDDFEVDAF